MTDTRHPSPVCTRVSAYRRGTMAGRLRDLLSASDEGNEVEFKSTLRYDLQLERNERHVTDAVLKTVAAFLNTRGGTLLIGVADDKSIVGIERDGFAGDDEFLRHLYTMVTNAMGPTVSPYIDATIAGTSHGKVCIVDVGRSQAPITCSLKNRPAAFFVRSGPATISLDEEQRDEFVRLHWSSEP